MHIRSTKFLAAGLFLFVGFGLSVTSSASTITAGSIVPGASLVDSCVSCDYILADPFVGTGYTLTDYTFTSHGAGDITPLLFTATTSGGNITFTLVGIGASQTVTGAGSTTFNFNLASGTDVTSGNTYFGFFSNTAVVSFSYGNATGGNYFAIPPNVPALGGTTTSNYSNGFQTNAIGSLNGREYSIMADAVLNATPVPEPSGLALLGTGIIALVGVGRQKFFKS